MLWAEIGEPDSASLAAPGADLQGLPQGPESGLEPGRPRAFQPGRKPARSGRAVRLYGHLYDAAFRAGQGAASAAGPGAARIRRRGQPGGFSRCCCRCSARPSPAPGSKPWSMRARSSIRCAGPAPRPRSLLRECRSSSARAWWFACRPVAANRPPRPRVTATVGARKPSVARSGRPAGFPDGGDAGRRALSEPEIGDCWPAPKALVLLRGHWVELDRERLECTMRGSSRQRRSWHTRRGWTGHPGCRAAPFAASAAVHAAVDRVAFGPQHRRHPSRLKPRSGSTGMASA